MKVNSDKSSTDYRIKSLLAGGIAGTAAKTAVAPLDRVKILFQTSHERFLPYHGKRFGYFKALMELRRTEGIIGLFRGHSATILRVFPYAGVKFMMYEQFKHWIMPGREFETNTRKFVSGALAGISAVIATYPFDLVRVRLAFESQGTSLTSLLTKILKEEQHGIANFYRGVLPTVLGMIPYAGVSFMTYDTLKTISFRFDFFKSEKGITPAATLISGALSGVIAQTCSYPIEVIRRHMQVSARTKNKEHTTIWGTAKDIFKKRGVRGLFAGLGLGYIKVGPMFAVSFYTYEYLKVKMHIN